MRTRKLKLDEIEKLVQEVFIANGCNAENTVSLTQTIVSAERDEATSHGMFRVPGYVPHFEAGRSMAGQILESNQ